MVSLLHAMLNVGFWFEEPPGLLPPMATGVGERPGDELGCRLPLRQGDMARQRSSPTIQEHVCLPEGQPVPTRCRWRLMPRFLDRAVPDGAAVHAQCNHPGNNNQPCQQCCPSAITGRKSPVPVLFGTTNRPLRLGRNFPGMTQGDIQRIQVCRRRCPAQRAVITTRGNPPAHGYICWTSRPPDQ